MTKLSNSLLARMLRLQKLFSDRRKWTQGNYQDRKANHTCYCFVGGLNKVRGRNPNSNFMTVESDEALALEFVTPEKIDLVDLHTSIITWNDDPKRTIKEVQNRVALGVKNARKLAKQTNQSEKHK